jgi:hypothetical protein
MLECRFLEGHLKLANHGGDQHNRRRSIAHNRVRDRYTVSGASANSATSASVTSVAPTIAAPPNAGVIARWPEPPKGGATIPQRGAIRFMRGTAAADSAKASSVSPRSLRISIVIG